MTRENPSKSVMLYATVDTFEANRGAVNVALDLCETINARLTGFLLNLDANAPAVLERSSSDLARGADRDERNNDNAGALMASAARRGLAAQCITTLDHSRGVIGCVADHARLHDVIVMGTASEGMMSDRSIAEALLFESGRPLIIAPPSHQARFSCRRIAAAWDNSRVAARALGDALAQFPDVEEIILLTIGGEKSIHSSLDDNAVERLLERRGVVGRIERKDVRGQSVGDALQAGALELDADLLVMGGYGHSRLRDFILGGATQAVLTDPRLPVMLSH